MKRRVIGMTRTGFLFLVLVTVPCLSVAGCATTNICKADRQELTDRFGADEEMQGALSRVCSKLEEAGRSDVGRFSVSLERYEAAKEDIEALRGRSPDLRQALDSSDASIGRYSYDTLVETVIPMARERARAEGDPLLAAEYLLGHLRRNRFQFPALYYGRDSGEGTHSNLLADLAEVYADAGKTPAAQRLAKILLVDPSVVRSEKGRGMWRFFHSAQTAARVGMAGAALAAADDFEKSRQQRFQQSCAGVKLEGSGGKAFRCKRLSKSRYDTAKLLAFAGTGFARDGEKGKALETFCRATGLAFGRKTVRCGDNVFEFLGAPQIDQELDLEAESVKEMVSRDHQQVQTYAATIIARWASKSRDLLQSRALAILVFADILLDVAWRGRLRKHMSSSCVDLAVGFGTVDRYDLFLLNLVRLRRVLPAKHAHELAVALMDMERCDLAFGAALGVPEAMEKVAGRCPHLSPPIEKMLEKIKKKKYLAGARSLDIRDVRTLTEGLLEAGRCDLALLGAASHKETLGMVGKVCAERSDSKALARVALEQARSRMCKKRAGEASKVVCRADLTEAAEVGLGFAALGDQETSRRILGAGLDHLKQMRTVNGHYPGVLSIRRLCRAFATVGGQDGIRDCAKAAAGLIGSLSEKKTNQADLSVEAAVIHAILGDNKAATGLLDRLETNYRYTAAARIALELGGWLQENHRKPSPANLDLIHDLIALVH